MRNDVISDASGPQHMMDILSDPQTSGGLLVSMPEKQALELVNRLNGLTPCSQIVGQVLAPQEKAIIVR